MSGKAILSALAQMNDNPSDVAQSLSECPRSARALSNDHPRLINEYPDQWVAIANCEVMAHGDNLDQVLADIDSWNIPRDSVILRFIEQTQRTLVL